MKVSTRVEYGVIALVDIALYSENGNSVSTIDIAKREGISKKYLEQIFPLLKMAGFIKAQKGIGGGYTMARKAETIRMSEVVNALDNSILDDMDDDESDTSSLGYVVNSNLWGDLNHTIKSFLEKLTLAENHVLQFCYSEYPGKDVDHIVYGTDLKWSRDGRLIHAHKLYCGKYANRQKLKDAYTEYVNANYATVHMSMIFNIFVFYTLFNQINCRVIDDSFNILIRITKSFLFPLICVCEMALQVLIIYIGKSPFHIVNKGFTGEQWGICFGFSAITFVVSFLVKLGPIHLLIDKFTKSKEENGEEEEVIDNKDKDKEKENEENISNGAEKNILKKEGNWDSDRILNEIVYKKEN